MTREEYIKALIKKQGMTIKSFAQRIGMPYSTLLSMLNGVIGGASIDNVVKICDGLGITVDQLQAASEQSVILEMLKPTVPAPAPRIDSREDYIKSRIKAKGMNLKSFAKSIDMPYSTLLSMLNGSIGSASINNVLKICHGLDISINDLENLSANSQTAPFEVDSFERTLVLEYRNRPELRPAINILLGLEQS